MLDQLFSCLDVIDNPPLNELVNHKGLEEFNGHFFGQAALVHAQLWPDHDHRTTRVVNPLAQKVLPKATLLPFDDVREGFEGAVISADDRTTATTVIDQSVHGFLKHPFFVTDDNLRRHDFLQTG